MSSAWETEASSQLANSKPTCFLIRRRNGTCHCRGVSTQRGQVPAAASDDGKRLTQCSNSWVSRGASRSGEHLLPILVNEAKAETRVEDADAAHAIVRGLGYTPVIAFEKRCRNYSFKARSREMLATLVRVPEVDGTFLEVETIVGDDQVEGALDDIRAVPVELGIAEEDLTRELYTDAVRSCRGV